MKKLLIILSLLILPALVRAESVQIKSVDLTKCGDAEAIVKLSVNPDGKLLILTLDDYGTGYTISGGSSSGDYTFQFPIKVGTRKIRAYFPDTGKEAVEIVKVENCEKGGGTLHPCQIEKTCPCFGFTLPELEKGYCEAPHVVLPQWYQEKQAMIKLVVLLQKLVGLYTQLFMISRP